MKLYCLVIIFFSVIFYGQHYTSQWYDMDDGLPQNSIKDIVKDRYGFIWMATDGGILRYDGKNFLLNNQFETGSLSFTDFIKTDNNTFITFANSEKECVSVSGRKTKEIPSSKELQTHKFIDIKQYKRFFKNSLIGKFFPDIDYYYITTGSGTYYFDNNLIQFRDHKDSKGKIIQRGIRHADLKHTFLHNDIVFIGDLKNRKTLILNHGVVSYDHNPSLYNDPKTRIYWHQATGQTFIINNDNIYLSTFIHGKLQPVFLLNYKNIKSEFLYSMYYDEDSRKLFLGNVVKGLNIITLSNFYVSQKNIPFSGEVQYEAVPFSKNSVITREGIEYKKDKAKRIYSGNIKFDKRYLLYDDDNNLLYVEFNKIHRRYSNSHYKKHDSIEIPHRIIDGLFKVGRWYAANVLDIHSNSSLYVYPDDNFIKPQHIFPFKENINSVIDISDDHLYVGTNDGMYLISISQKKIIKKLTGKIPVKQITRTQDGNCWITTYNKGFYLFKNQKVLRMPEDKNGYISSAHTLLEDKKANLWISTNNGLFKIPKKSLLDYAADRHKKVTYYRYTKENGLLNNEFNGSSNQSANALQNGEFVFPSMEGFVFFTPSEIRSHYPTPGQIYIERAKVGNKTVNITDKFYLKSDYKNAEIFIDIPYYYNLENIYLEARLESGKNEKWETIKADRKYLLNNIEPGKYMLAVRFMVSEDGKFAYKRIPVEIKPSSIRPFGLK